MAGGAKPRYLTKSRYKLAVECPTKLFYAGKPRHYADASVDDPFLKALAKGGFQVGALAKCYYPGGIEVEGLDHDRAVAETARLLAEREHVTIFEAALRFDQLFVRVDVLVNAGRSLQLLEVKSKSFDPMNEEAFFDKAALKKGVYKLKGDYAEYLYDVAFQAHVCKLALPDYQVSSFLLMPNKAARTSVDGLNQLFLLKGEMGRPEVITSQDASKERLGAEILIKVNVDDAVALIHQGKNAERGPEDRCLGLPYAEELNYFAVQYAKDVKIAAAPDSRCKKCEFRAEPGGSQKSGFSECWQTTGRLGPAEVGQPLVFDIWNFRGADRLIADGKALMTQVTRDDVIKKSAKEADSGLSMAERQWLQVEKVRSGSKEPYVDRAGLLAALSSWTFPLHFIDFETTMVAIPFHKGQRPYEQMAFQFSHHVLYADGRIEHADQYLNTKPGVFPNFDFARALKRSLEGDGGTIFRYAAHENTVLCQIHEQLRNSQELDASELMTWIRTITTSSSSAADQWEGPRSMVDLCELVKRYYYHPHTKGSNSIKKVLPAILGDSKLLQTKYAQATYGSNGGIKSLNFRD